MYRTAVMAEVIWTAAVMTTVKTAAVVITDKKGDSSRHIGGNSGA
jgi:hypothetical protein